MEGTTLLVMVVDVNNCCEEGEGIEVDECRIVPVVVIVVVDAIEVNEEVNGEDADAVAGVAGCRAVEVVALLVSVVTEVTVVRGEGRRSVRASVCVLMCEAEG